MTNISTEFLEQSIVKYCDLGSAFIVVWENVLLVKDVTERPNDPDIFNSLYTFSLTLHSNGNITIAYKVVPVEFRGDNIEKYSIKIGISDAFANKWGDFCKFF